MRRILVGWAGPGPSYATICLIGATVLLFLARRYGRRFRPGDIAGLFFIWYATTRFTLEPLRADTWTFFGIPTAMIVSAVVIVAAIVVLVLRHRSDIGRPAPQPSA